MKQFEHPYEQIKLTPEQLDEIARAPFALYQLRERIIYFPIPASWVHPELSFELRESEPQPDAVVEG